MMSSIIFLFAIWIGGMSFAYFFGRFCDYLMSRKEWWYSSPFFTPLLLLGMFLICALLTLKIIFDMLAVAFTL